MHCHCVYLSKKITIFFNPRRKNAHLDEGLAGQVRAAAVLAGVVDPDLRKQTDQRIKIETMYVGTEA
jgi:hypothetical protein